MDDLNRWLGKFLMWLTLLITGVVVYGVAARYFVGRADVRVIFVSVWMYGTLFVLGGGYTLLERGHVSVDILYSRLPSRARSFLDLLNLSLIVLCCAVILYVNVPLAYQSFVQREVDSSLGVVFAPPIWWFKWVPVFGTALLGLQAASLLLKQVKEGAVER